MVFDDAAVIASANLSLSSWKNLIEAGLITHDAATVTGVPCMFILYVHLHNIVSYTNHFRHGRLVVWGVARRAYAVPCDGR